jgi:branched-subunit amino acid aminotransferase/4-amino-4-deoxychorismate lyase
LAGLADGGRAEPPGDETLAGWSDGEHRLVPAPAGMHRLDVADSFLVADGLVRGLPWHAERFAESCRRRHGVATVATMRFVLAACAALPRAGRWFPRLEFTAGSGFRLRLRPAPPQASGVVLTRADGPDRRSDPAVKGPDLSMLTGLRQSAAARGADEVLLVSDAGTVLEGALSAVLWWRGDVLCMPPLDLPVLPSVTRRLLAKAAVAAGIEVRLEVCRPDDLDGLEVWSVGALHGIRPVTGWLGAGLTVGPARLASAWQARLAAQSTPIDAAVVVMSAVTSAR